MMRALRLASSAVMAATLVLAPNAGAQSALSLQGYGYPQGGLGTRAGAAGGAFAEFDATSSRNPTSLADWSGRAGLYFQYEPEFRRVSAGNRTDKTTTARFPAVLGALPVFGRGMLAFSASSFLDRSFATKTESQQVFGVDTVRFTESVLSTGAINDLRIAGSYVVAAQFVVGAGLHVYTGENRFRIAREFPDSSVYGTLRRNSVLEFTGTGISGGVQWRPLRLLAIAASGRMGGTLEALINDSTVSKASIPDRFGIGLRFDGLPGTSIAISADHIAWSQMNGLATARVNARDAWDYGVGVDLAASRLRGAPVAIRAGYRKRTLPFDAAGQEVTESSFSGGLSLPIAGPRAGLDLSLVRATRDATLAVKESAWTISMGLTVRP